MFYHRYTDSGSVLGLLWQEGFWLKICVTNSENPGMRCCKMSFNFPKQGKHMSVSGGCPGNPKDLNQKQNNAYKRVHAQSQDIALGCKSTHHLQVWSLHGLTCDICGLKLISFRSTDPGERLCNIWHKSTPSRRACAKSKTAAEGHTTRWFGGRTLQSINHRPHCLHSSISAPETLSSQSNRVLELVRSGTESSGSRRTRRHYGRFPTCAGCFTHSLSAR